MCLLLKNRMQNVQSRVYISLSLYIHIYIYIYMYMLVWKKIIRNNTIFSIIESMIILKRYSVLENCIFLYSPPHPGFTCCGEVCPDNTITAI